MSEGNIVFMNGQYHNTTNWGVVQWANYYDYLHGTQEDPNAIGGVFQEPTFFGDENYPSYGDDLGLDLDYVTPGFNVFNPTEIPVVYTPDDYINYPPNPANPDAYPALGENPENGVYKDVSGTVWHHHGDNIWLTTAPYDGVEVPWGRC